jgi:hypothetical protein
MNYTTRFADMRHSPHALLIVGGLKATKVLVEL